MERKTIGAFIAVLRKARGLTQRQLAEMLNVSDKTVSRWERDEGCPDLSLIPVLAEIFSVSCDELLRGERIPQEDREKAGERGRDRTERQRRHLLTASFKRFKNRSYVAMALAVGGLTAAMVANFGFYRGRLGFFLGLPFFLAAVFCQMIFRNNALGTVAELEEEESLGRFRLRVLHITEFCLGLDLVLFSATLPLGTLSQANAGMAGADWLRYGGACGAAAALALCVGCYFINFWVRGKEGYSQGEKADRVYRENHRLKGRLGLVFAALLLVTGFAHLSLTQIWGPGTIMEGIEFDDLNSFAEFMEKEEGMPLHDYDYNAKFYDEQGKEISSQEANRKYLTDGNGKVILEYVQNNRTICSVQASFRGDELLELRAFTYEELDRARAIVRQRNGIFAAAYVMELLTVTAVYFKKRVK